MRYAPHVAAGWRISLVDQARENGLIEARSYKRLCTLLGDGHELVAACTSPAEQAWSAIVGGDFDVVVVGGGPVGRWQACELALAKVKVAVIERRTERVTQSRGLTIHGRTLEMFALRGLAERGA
jgi:hypothetical protein